VQASPTILVTGAKGQLGCELAAALAAHGRVVALDRAALDLARPADVRAALRTHAPALIVNAAAYTAVDRAESEPALARAVNAEAPGLLADLARDAGATLIHYSTDYVFDGKRDTPYDEDCPTAPQSVYGETKRAGEEAILASGVHALILRTSWVYGMRGKNFLLTIRRLAAEREELRIVSDQFGVPNWCRELAYATARLVGGGLPYLRAHGGLYHMSATGATTWYEFARAIVQANPPTGRRVRIVPIATADYPTAARRPAYAVLSTARFERTFGFALRPWRDSLAACMKDPAEPDAAAAVGRPRSVPPAR
jgi:dTDP-4-dehydrorhamnose reductase